MASATLPVLTISSLWQVVPFADVYLRYTQVSLMPVCRDIFPLHARQTCSPLADLCHLTRMRQRPECRGRLNSGELTASCCYAAFVFVKA